MNLGYAKSEDGIHWKEHAGNPILTAKDLPFAPDFQTPFVLFDEDEKIYKMWFVGLYLDTRNKKMDQLLGYATSPDGVRWKIHPEPIYWSGLSFNHQGGSQPLPHVDELTSIARYQRHGPLRIHL
jgi:hypothetical protein